MKRGYTLMELMIVGAILGALGAYAVSAYKGYSARGSFSEMQTMAVQLLQDAQANHHPDGNFPTIAELAQTDLRYAVFYDGDNSRWLVNDEYFLELDFGCANNPLQGANVGRPCLAVVSGRTDRGNAQPTMFPNYSIDNFSRETRN